ncbi:MAG: hypothetical protein ABJB16_11220 [Saprospiraceae bacterium]
MKSLRFYLFLIIASIIDLVLFNDYFSGVIIFILTGYVLLRFIKNLTKSIILPEIISLTGCIVYLIMPWIAFQYFPKSNKLANLWDIYMKVDYHTYFSLALPGTLLLIVGLNCSLPGIDADDDVSLVDNCKRFLNNRKFVGVTLVCIGIVSAMTINYFPESMQSIVYFFIQLTFIGFLYILHSRLIKRIFIIPIALTLLVGQSILTGMYGEFIFWSMFGSIIILMGQSSFTIPKRILFVVTGIFLILLIQSIKQEYRRATWKGENRTNNPALFFSLLKERISDPSSIINPERSFSLVARGNQGFLISRVMAYVPKRTNFVHGETILTSLAASFVPRFLWSDKPEVGGKENVCRFMGDCGNYHYSYNIGQLGEGYVNFGVTGGSIFMFFYGLFIRFSLDKIRSISRVFPTLILWVPLFYFAALSLETDFLSVINTFMKTLIFCFVCYAGFSVFLKVKL